MENTKTKKHSMRKMLICMSLILIACIGITFGITLAYFGDVKTGSASITLGASIYFDETNGVAVSASGSTAVVPSQSIDVSTNLKIIAGNGTVTKGVLKVMPDFQAGDTGATCTFTAGSTYDVSIGGTKSTDAVMVVYQNELFLVKKSDTTKLYEITPSTSGLQVSFSVPVTVPETVANEASGKTCTIKMTAVVLQSTIYTSATATVPLTITDFLPYFTQTVADTMPTENLAATASSDGKSAVLTGAGTTFSGGRLVVPSTLTVDGKELPVTEIGNSAFKGNTTITEVVLPKSVKTISKFSFMQCSNLQHINLDNVTSIDGETFLFCSSLEYVNMPLVESIGQFTFYECSSLAYVNLPNVKSVGKSAFWGCKPLKNIELPLVTNLTRSAFNECISLEYVDLPLLEKVEEFVFSGCTSLKKINMPNVKYVEYSATQYCASLEVDLHEGLLWIGDCNFTHAANNTQTSITIPSTIKQLGGREYKGDNNTNAIVGSHIFYNSSPSTLKEYKVASGNTNFVVHEGALYTKDYKYLVAYPPAKSSVSYTMPEGCVDMFELAFSRPYNLINLTIPNSFEVVSSKNVHENFINNYNPYKSNGLNTGLYEFASVQNFLVKSDNTKYQSIDGVLYNKSGTELIAKAPAKYDKATWTIADSCTTITSIPFMHGSIHGEYATVGGVQVGGMPSKIVIGKNLTNIDDEVIFDINNESWTIEVDSANTVYTVTNGKLAKK